MDAKQALDILKGNCAFLISNREANEIATLIESLAADVELKDVAFRLANKLVCNAKSTAECSPCHWQEYCRLRAEKTKKESSVNLKNLVYSFLNLSYVTRVEILKKFDLLEPEDTDARHVDILQKIIDKAKVNECLEDFWQEVSQCAGKAGE